MRQNPRKPIAKWSHVSRTRRQPFADTSQFSSRDPYAIQMRIVCDTYKTISQCDCEKIKLIDTRANVVTLSRERLTTVV